MKLSKARGVQTTEVYFLQLWKLGFLRSRGLADVAPPRQLAPGAQSGAFPPGPHMGLLSHSQELHIHD